MADKPMKDGVPAGSFLVRENPFKTATWHLQVRDAQGKPDHRLMGAAWAALHGGYRGNKYEGPAKAQALSDLKKLYASENMPLPSEKEFHVYKDANGAYRWVLFSSSAFMDQDGEIITEKALAEDVARCDASGVYGPLRWWHMGGWEAPDGLENWQTWKAGPGVDLGTCDFNMLYGKVLIESGTFRDNIIGEAFSNKTLMNELEVSIGYAHPKDEPGTTKTYDNIHRFERSLLPAGMASNLLTKYIVTKGETTMKAQEKLKALAAILRGNKDLAEQILANAEGIQKAAEEAGLSTKEVTDLLDPEQTPEPVKKELSLGDRIGAVMNAVHEKFMPPMQSDPMEPCMVDEIFDTFVIMEQGEKKSQVDYTIADDGTVTLSDPVEVTETYVPVGKSVAILKEWKAATPPPPPPAAPVAEPPADPASQKINDMTKQELANFVAEVVKQMSAKEAQDKRTEELAGKIDSMMHALGMVSDLKEQLEKQQQTLSDLTDSRPVGIKQLQSLRPTESARNVIKDAPAGPQIDPSFLKYAQGGK